MMNLHEYNYIQELFMKKYIHNSSTFSLWIKIHNFKLSNNKFIPFSWTFYEYFMNVIPELFKKQAAHGPYHSAERTVQIN